LRRSLFVVLLMFLVSCVSNLEAESVDLAVARKAIDAANAKYVECFQKRDAKAFGQLFTEDAVVMEPAGVVIRGRSKIEEWLLADTNEVPVKDGTITTMELYEIDGAIYETGKFRFVFQPAGKEERVAIGKYVDVWEKQTDGSWKIKTEVNIANE
jgi:uncharacterized protein (TIGR02246 family)